MLRRIRSNHTLVSMIVLGGLGSFFIGASMQSSMPIFAHDLGAGSAGTAYGVLLFANGVGGVIGGILLEATGWIKPTVAAAVVSTAVYGLTTLFFAAAGQLPAGRGAAGDRRRRQPGLDVDRPDRRPAAGARPPTGAGSSALYGMSANGLRVGSGFTVGLLGAVDRHPLVARAQRGRPVRRHAHGRGVDPAQPGRAPGFGRARRSRTRPASSGGRVQAAGRRALSVT